LTLTSLLTPRGSSFCDIARMLELSTIFCSGSIIGLKWFLITISSSVLAGFQGAMFFIDRLDRFFNLPYNLLTLAYISVMFILSHVYILPTLVYQKRLIILRHRKFVKSFSVSSVSKRTCLSPGIHTFAANNCGIIHWNLRMICWYSHDHCTRVYYPAWTELTDSRCLV